MSELLLKSPAKLNLTLEVSGKRPDGFHNIRSAVVGLDWGDELSFRSDADGRRKLHCTHPEVPLDRNNLILRAADLLARHGNCKSGCEIHLAKRIPIGGGMGGGSSNAAATLVGLNQLWSCGVRGDGLAALGSELGSDIPLFFQLPSAQISGRGEKVTPFELAWAGWFVLVTSGMSVSTSAVYQAWRSADRSLRPTADLLESGAVRTAKELGAMLFNDLESAIGRVCPAMSELRIWVESIACRPVRITGAGGVVFAVFDTAAEADDTLGELSRRDDRLTCWKARPLTQPVWPQ